jgi:hypothetical protein
MSLHVCLHVCLAFKRPSRKTVSFVQPDQTDEVAIVWTLLALLTIKGGHCRRPFQGCLLGGRQ